MEAKWTGEAQQLRQQIQKEATHAQALQQCVDQQARQQEKLEQQMAKLEGRMDLQQRESSQQEYELEQLRQDRTEMEGRIADLQARDERVLPLVERLTEQLDQQKAEPRRDQVLAPQYASTPAQKGGKESVSWAAVPETSQQRPESFSVEATGPSSTLATWGSSSGHQANGHGGQSSGQPWVTQPPAEQNQTRHTGSQTGAPGQSTGAPAPTGGGQPPTPPTPIPVQGQPGQPPMWAPTGYGVPYMSQAQWTAPKRNRNQTSLPQFSGEAHESLQSFLNKIENGARLGSWDQEYKRGQLYAQLAGGALQYVDGLPEGEKDSYDRMAAMLRGRYEGELEREKSREALRMIRRGRGETLEELGRRIKELTRKAVAPERREEEGLIALRNALSDKQAELVVTQGYRTVDSCIEQLSKLECYQDHRARHRQQHRLQQIMEVEPEEEMLPPVSSSTMALGVKEGQLAQVRTGGAPAQPAQLIQPAPPVPPVTPTADHLQLQTQELLKEMLKEMRKRPQPAPVPAKTAGKETKPGGGNGPPRRNWRTYPSADRPCELCGSPAHWKVHCPKRNEKKVVKENSKGTGPEVRGQPRQ